jgi:transcriptional regulator with XRE-family HTH domain
MRRRVETPYQANLIAQIRESRRLSMEQLGAMLVPPATGSQINKLEKGQTQLTIDWLYRLSRALNCYPQELLPDLLGPPISREEQLFVDLLRELGEQQRRTAYHLLDALKRTDPVPVALDESPERNRQMKNPAAPSCSKPPAKD